MPLYDAHCHWADQRLAGHWKSIDADLRKIGLARAVVNGTSPGDWTPVLELAKRDDRVLPAIGLHPWKVNHAPANWRDRFLHALDHGARAIGEIGLDQWIEGHDIDRQLDAFHWQLQQAAERDLPVSIHCLKATGPLMKALKEAELPERGIHLHALNAPLEVFEQLAGLGARFSFNAGQLKPKHKKAPEAIRAIPSERLLVESDAPDFLPAEVQREFELPDALNHPANLRAAYRAIADLRETSVETLAEQVARNFKRYFLE
ncbi:MAG: TatD family hydrolase [Opitutales bacterium]